MGCGVSTINKDVENVETITEDDEQFPEIRYFKQIEKEKSIDVQKKWDRVPSLNETIKAYRVALKDICLKDEDIVTSSLLKAMNWCRTYLKENQKELQQFRNVHFFESQIAIPLIMKAYNCDNRIKARDECRDFVTGQNVFHVLKNLYESMKHKEEYVAYSLQIILKYHEKDGIAPILSEIADRIVRCSSARRQAFNMILLHGYKTSQCYDNKNIHNSLTDTKKSEEYDGNYTPQDENDTVATTKKKEYEKAKKAFQNYFHDYLDDHKERAFTSGFVEPSRYYFSLIHDTHGKDHVNVHGFNIHLAILLSTIGFHVNQEPELHDPWADKGMVDHWEGLQDTIWEEVFSDPMNFGLSFEGIKSLKKGNCRQKYLKPIRPSTLCNPSGKNDTPKIIANNAVSPHLSNVQRERVARLLKRFAFFFSKDFFLKKAYETLNAENKPEHVGFRQAAEIIFLEFKKEHDTGEAESLVEYVYADEYYTELSIEKVNTFFVFCDVVKASHHQLNTNNNDNNSNNNFEENKMMMIKECPICFVETDDLVVFPHWEAKGDISGHSMCNDCLQMYGKSECPFCREVSHKEELMPFIQEFLQSIDTTRGKGDPDKSAQVMEGWQLFEMEHIGQPSVIARVGGMILHDNIFMNALRDGVHYKQDWVRDMAGVIFRLYSIVRENELENINDETKKIICNAVDAIFKPLETNTPKIMSPHHYGSFYTQAVAAWLCAYYSGAKTTVLKQLVIRTANVIINTHKKHKILNTIKERFAMPYISQSHEPIWGGRKEDPIFQTFLK